MVGRVGFIGQSMGRGIGRFSPSTGGGVPPGFVALLDIDGSPLTDLDGQPLYEAA